MIRPGQRLARRTNIDPSRPTRQPSTMPRPSPLPPSVPLCLRAYVPLLLAAAVASADPDAAFRAAWQRTTQRPDIAVEVWEAFIEAHRTHDLGQTARLLLATHHLRSGAAADGVLPLLRHQPGPTAPEPGSLRATVAHAMKGLTARLQMNRLVESGHLAASDLIDPFGRPYTYAALARRLMPDVPRQVYTLRCVTIDADRRDYAPLLKATARPVAGLTVVRLMPQRELCQVEVPGDHGVPLPRRWKTGTRVRGLTLWSVRPACIIVAREQFPFVLEPVETARAPVGGDRPRSATGPS